ncbi:MAG: hypothetical protein MZV64_65200 [Ignavibacteriales bacterium]|nr:hypothetical protein [Ignavibacteriales bacterium]
MNDKQKPEIGSITWCDLTVPNAEEVKDFYAKVVGWMPQGLSVGDYEDFTMSAPESNKVCSRYLSCKRIKCKTSSAVVNLYYR